MSAKATDAVFTKATRGSHASHAALGAVACGLVGFTAALLLRQYRRHEPAARVDLYVSDVRMPVVSGLEIGSLGTISFLSRNARGCGYRLGFVKNFV